MDEPLPDPSLYPWRKLSAWIQRSDGTDVEIELLRPAAWIEEQGFERGLEMFVNLAELEVAGWRRFIRLSLARR